MPETATRPLFTREIIDLHKNCFPGRTHTPTVVYDSKSERRVRLWRRGDVELALSVEGRGVPSDLIMIAGINSAQVNMMARILLDAVFDETLRT